MAGAFHGVGENDCVVNVGVSGPGVVEEALKHVKGENLTVVAETIKKVAYKITRVGQLVAQEASKRLGANFGIIDLSLAPTPVKGDSVAHILEEIGVDTVGGYGTTAALALLNDAVKRRNYGFVARRRTQRCVYPRQRGYRHDRIRSKRRSNS